VDSSSKNEDKFNRYGQIDLQFHLKNDAKTGNDFFQREPFVLNKG